MKQLTRHWRVLLLALTFTVVGALIGGVTISRATPTDGEPYRVELVLSDQYRVQKALNQMAKQGWFFVSSVPRQDGKVLILFRKAQ
jgi:hypothetical protein